MRTIKVEELFVFAGAGVSLSAPAGLPLFPWLRDEILNQLELSEYVPRRHNGISSHQQRVAEGLAPEPFMLALRRGGAEVAAWLGAVLSRGTPNAAHAALAQLATAGARVWTVNFDTLIEQASSGGLAVRAWPDEPSSDAQLLKPHGTLPGRLIVDSEQVLRGLEPSWERQVRADVHGRTVVFIGYSGRDLDFQPLWDDILLRHARRVLWFDLPNPDEQQRRTGMLRGVAAAGRLHFPPPPLVRSGGRPNPSWDFVRWCGERGLVDVDEQLVARLHEQLPDVRYPRLQGAIPFARAATQQILGDRRAARRSYVGLLAGSHRRRAAGELTRLTLNHGGRLVATALAVAQLLPAVGRAKQVRVVAHRKRTTILSNLGRHTAVLRATARIAPDDVSSLLVLRASALRMTGSLDAAAALAEQAMRQALGEHHPVRVAHAAFQRGLALVWAYRLQEADRHLHDHQRPYAALAATRWVAWADFVQAGLAIHHRQLDLALQALDAGAARFQAEGLLDGQIDMATVRLTALRLAGDDDAFQQQRTALEDLMDPSHRQGIRYARGHRFTSEAIALEDAEFARVHRGDLDAAEALYRYVAASTYPIHAALGHLGLAAVHAQRGGFPSHAQQAASLGRVVDARLVIAKAEQLLAASTRTPIVPNELFFP